MMKRLGVLSLLTVASLLLLVQLQTRPAAAKESKRGTGGEGGNNRRTAISQGSRRCRHKSRRNGCTDQHGDVFALAESVSGYCSSDEG